MPKLKKRNRQCRDACMVSREYRIKRCEDQINETDELTEKEYYQSFNLPTINQDYYDFLNIDEYFKDDSDYMDNKSNKNDASIPVEIEKNTNELTNLFERNLKDIPVNSFDIDHLSIFIKINSLKELFGTGLKLSYKLKEENYKNIDIPEEGFFWPYTNEDRIIDPYLITNKSNFIIISNDPWKIWVPFTKDFKTRFFSSLHCNEFNTIQEESFDKIRLYPSENDLNLLANDYNSIPINKIIKALKYSGRSYVRISIYGQKDDIENFQEIVFPLEQAFNKDLEICKCGDIDDSLKLMPNIYDITRTIKTKKSIPIFCAPNKVFKTNYLKSEIYPMFCGLTISLSDEEKEKLNNFIYGSLKVQIKNDNRTNIEIKVYQYLVHYLRDSSVDFNKFKKLNKTINESFKKLKKKKEYMDNLNLNLGDYRIEVRSKTNNIQEAISMSLKYWNIDYFETNIPGFKVYFLDSKKYLSHLTFMINMFETKTINKLSKSKNGKVSEYFNNCFFDLFNSFGFSIACRNYSKDENKTSWFNIESQIVVELNELPLFNPEIKITKLEFTNLLDKIKWYNGINNTFSWGDRKDESSQRLKAENIKFISNRVHQTILFVNFYNTKLNIKEYFTIDKLTNWTSFLEENKSNNLSSIPEYIEEIAKINFHER